MERIPDHLITDHALTGSPMNGPETSTDCIIRSLIQCTHSVAWILHHHLIHIALMLTPSSPMYMMGADHYVMYQFNGDVVLCLSALLCGLIM